MFKNQGIMKCFSFDAEKKKTTNQRCFDSFFDLGRKFLPFFITILSFSFVNAQVIVNLGNDLAICEGDNAVLADFNPTVSGANGDKWWETSGDGTFNNTVLYPSAVSYSPGSADLAAGQVTITLKARETNPNGTVYEDSAVLYIRGDELFACNDNITIPLNFYCEYQVTPPILLEGEDENVPYNLYNIDIYDEDGDLVPNNLITGDYIGQTLSYNITHQCSWNACGGTINVKDNYHPVTSCGNDTITCQYSLDPFDLGFPIDTAIFDLDTIFKVDSQKYIVQGWDACGDVQLSYLDSTFLYDCTQDTFLQELVVRFWKAVDESGNVSRCRDSIFVKRIHLDSVILPPSWNNIDTTALQCNGDWLDSALPNGNPSPEYTGAPEVWWCSNVEYSYSDTEFPGCGNTFDVARDWILIDWCTSETFHYNQIIKVMDTIPPTMNCIDGPVTVGSDPYECNSVSYELALPEIYDECSSYTLFVHVYDADNHEVSVQKLGGSYFVSHLPLGNYTVKFTAVDECNNISKCQYDFEVVDDQRPYAVCDQHTKVNLGSNGEARLYPNNIDDGSFDNCEIVDWKIRKMTYECDSAYFEFGDYVGFCCAESGDTVMVSMQVTDASGNSNTCMVEVLVEDKLPPQIICPPDITISCDFYFDPNDLDRYFGKVVTDQTLREDIVIFDQYNHGVVGQDGYAYDNCDVTVTSSTEFDVNNCNIGKIYRTFTAVDNGGRTNPCLQTITIYNPEPFNYYGDDIIWPADTVFYGCSNLEADTAITGAPIVDDNTCSMVAIRYDDVLFSVQDDACEKIVRKWTIRDWCQSNDIFWTHDQVIMLNNNEAPTFTSDCFDRDVCVYGNCEGLVELSASAEDDCTPEEDLVWRWKLDRDGDGVFDEFGQGNHFAKTMEIGTYEIVWIVEDKCGNQNYCDYKFNVKDCKNPTPYCISDLTTVVMNQVGMVTVNAQDFDHGSYDNCTPSNYGTCGCLTDLKFSFSQDVNDTTYVITCDSLVSGVARTFYLKMWVTDEAGNQDFCSIQLQVQDNNDVCPDSDGIQLSGTLNKWKDGSPVKGINVKMNSTDYEINKYEDSQTNGVYKFDNISSGNSYIVNPQDDKETCISGVSTADLVKIQKHILGIKNFDSPYQYLAADANNSKSISAADILAIRKLVLGVYNEFPNNQCWLYADAKQQLSTANPYDFRSKLQFNNLTSSVTDANFKVIKVGDVNDNHIPEQSGMEMRNDENVVMELGDDRFVANQIVKVPVYISSENGLEGLQFTAKFNPDFITFQEIENGAIAINESNLGLSNIESGKLSFSWNTIGNESFDKNVPLFYMVFHANKNGFVSTNLDITDEVTKTLSVVSGEEAKVKVLFRNTDKSDSFIVFQNTPNPFKNETEIKFSLTQNANVELNVFDITGKIVYKTSGDFAKGISRFVVKSADLSSKGVFYYSLTSNGNKSTKKMIVID